MKSAAIATALLVLLAATAAAGEMAVSKATLAEMGLGPMQPLSDHDGLAVRGKGILDGLLSLLIPGWPPEVPDPAPEPHGPPTGPPPSYQSPFGDDSILGGTTGGSQQFGSGPSVGGNTFGFQGNFPWPLKPM
jgi:hypothetical protein